MNWNKLDSFETLSEIIRKSFHSPIVLFKHSTRCSISSLALNRMSSRLKNDIEIYILDIIEHRDMSNKVAQQLNVIHQSPQLIIIHQGKCIYNASHYEISASVLEKKLDLLK